MAKTDDKTIMAPAAMKPLLMLSKRQPVSCAIGLSKDKQGLILLDKKAKPRKLVAMLKKEAAEQKIDLDTPSIRFGRAEVDTEVDSSLVQFKVNKEAAGTLRPKLLEQLKKAGFQKCEIVVDEALETEEDEEVAAEGGDGATMAKPQDAAPAEGVAGAKAEDAPDLATVTKRLTDAVKRMLPALAANPPGADAMKTAAQAGQAALKSGDVAGAASAADTLERLLDAMPAAGAPAASGSGKGPAMGSPVFAKAEATWVATRKKIESELEKLHDELQSVYKGHGVVADLEKAFRSKVEPMMANLDHSLSDKLAEVGKNSDPAAHGKMVGEVQAIIQKYESYLAGDPLIAKLDDNPFVPLSIEKTLTASLAALSKVIA